MESDKKPSSTRQTPVESIVMKTADDKKENQKGPEPSLKIVQEKICESGDQDADALLSIGTEKLSLECENKPVVVELVPKKDNKIFEKDTETEPEKPQTGKMKPVASFVKLPATSSKKLSDSESNKKCDVINDESEKLFIYFRFYQGFFSVKRDLLLDMNRTNENKLRDWHNDVMGKLPPQITCLKHKDSKKSCNCVKKFNDIDFAVKFETDMQNSDLWSPIQKVLDNFGNVEEIKEQLETCLENMASACKNLSSAFNNNAKGAEILFMSCGWPTLRKSIGDDLTKAVGYLNDPCVKKFFAIEQFSVKDVLEKMNADLEEFSVDDYKIELNV